MIENFTNFHENNKRKDFTGTLIVYELLQSGYDECTPTNPLRCELGDQASKLARYDIGSGRKFFTDVNLPIIGEYSGKS